MAFNHRVNWIGKILVKKMIVFTKYQFRIKHTVFCVLLVGIGPVVNKAMNGLGPNWLRSPFRDWFS